VSKHIPGGTIHGGVTGVGVLHGHHMENFNLGGRTSGNPSYSIDVSRGPLGNSWRGGLNWRF
jgi:hypothetical protein